MVEVVLDGTSRSLERALLRPLVELEPSSVTTPLPPLLLAVDGLVSIAQPSPDCGAAAVDAAAAAPSPPPSPPLLVVLVLVLALVCLLISSLAPAIFSSIVFSLILP